MRDTTVVGPDSIASRAQTYRGSGMGDRAKYRLPSATSSWNEQRQFRLLTCSPKAQALKTSEIRMQGRSVIYECGRTII
jgi:hypothetical protein